MSRSLILMRTSGARWEDSELPLTEPQEEESRWKGCGTFEGEEGEEEEERDGEEGGGSARSGGLAMLGDSTAASSFSCAMSSQDCIMEVNDKEERRQTRTGRGTKMGRCTIEVCRSCGSVDSFCPQSFCLARTSPSSS
eukprot:755133-Hanusia_phi.AAC.1